MPTNDVVTREIWLEARLRLLALEKKETRLRDEVNAARLALPWVRIDKEYSFKGEAGELSLADLFAGRSQLVLYHFMLGPGWAAGCPGCSFLADHLDGALPHLSGHDVSLVAASRAPFEEITSYRRRMGWSFPWVSTFASDFNYDFSVSFKPEDLATGKITYNYRELPSADISGEQPGLSSFFRNERGEIFHTYSSFARGVEQIASTFMILDLAPLGRNETEAEDFPKRHDEY